jgi:hypothetical protein
MTSWNFVREARGALPESVLGRLIVVTFAAGSKGEWITWNADRRAGGANRAR